MNRSLGSTVSGNDKVNRVDNDSICIAIARGELRLPRLPYKSNTVSRSFRFGNGAVISNGQNSIAFLSIVLNCDSADMSSNTQVMILAVNREIVVKNVDSSCLWQRNRSK